MDAAFSAGKFKGRWFSDVASQEPAFCAWARKQKAPGGSLKAFLEYLRAGRRGQRALDGFGFAALPRKPDEAGSGGGLEKRFECTLLVTVATPAEFDVGPENPNFEVPQTIRMALTAHPSARQTEAACHWRFPAASYAQVLRWLQWNLAFRCKVEPVPPWVLRRLPAFMDVVERVQASSSLKLSSSTRRLLAELPPMPPAPAHGKDSVASSASADRKMDLSALNGSLLPFQREAVAFGMAAGGRLLLGDEMGLGKTVSALALARQYVEEWPALVVAPAPLCSVWREHALSWLGSDLGPEQVCVVRSSRDAPPPTARLLIVSYNLVGEAKFQTKADGTGDYQVVILDECHLLRAGASRRARATIPLAQRARRAVLLSGTPLVSMASDAYPLLDALLPPGDLPTLSEFLSRYREAAPEPQQASPASSSSCVRHRVARGAKAVRNIAELHLVLGSVMLRRLKADLLPQLPAKRRQRVILDAPTGRHSAAPGFRPGNLDGTKAGSAAAPELERACEDLVPAKVSAMKDYLHCLLEAGVKFLLFALHLRVLDELEQLLRAKATGYVRIDGSTAVGDRAEAVARFQNEEEIQVALLSLTACCQGLTLHAASLVVFAELFWVPGVLLQAEDRAHRLGQACSVNVHYLVLRGTVDEHMFRAVERRAADTTAVLDWPEAASSVVAPASASGAGRPSFQAEETTVAAALEAATSSHSSVETAPCGEPPRKRPRPAAATPERPAAATGASGASQTVDSDSESLELVSCSSSAKCLAAAWGSAFAG